MENSVHGEKETGGGDLGGQKEEKKRGIDGREDRKKKIISATFQGKRDPVSYGAGG